MVIFGVFGEGRRTSQEGKKLTDCRLGMLFEVGIGVGENVESGAGVSECTEMREDGL